MIQHIKFRKMTEDEYIRWEEWENTNYIQELMEARQISECEARAQIEKEHSECSLPIDNLFVSENNDGTPVGVIWYVVQDANRIFILNFVVYEEHRRMGYGSAILAELECRAKSEGFSIINFHVFEHNKAAIELYKKCGYKIVQDTGNGGMYMEKHFCDTLCHVIPRAP